MSPPHTKRQLCPTPTQSHARLAGEKDVCCRSITKLEIIDRRGLTLELCARLRCRCPQCQCHGPVPDLRALNTHPTQVATAGIGSSSQSLTSVSSTLAQHNYVVTAGTGSSSQSLTSVRSTLARRVATAGIGSSSQSLTSVRSTLAQHVATAGIASSSQRLASTAGRS